VLRSRILATAVVLAPTVALAAPSSQVQSLRRRIAALQFDHALGLSKQQAQAPLPLIEEARAKVGVNQSQRAVSEPVRAAALSRAVADLQATGTISDSRAEAIQSAREGSRSSLGPDLRSVWSEAKQICTADQLNALRSTRLGVGQGVVTGGRSGRMGPRRFAGRTMGVRTLLSDEFLSLVKARAS